MKSLKITTLVIFTLSFSQVFAQDCVILLHGLARSEASMKKIEEYLLAEGYKVVNEGYKSTGATVEAISNKIIPEALSKCDEGLPVHFVTHSMGGILVRYYLSKNDIKHLGRVVMLGPPNKGSQVVDKLGNIPGFKLINGPAGVQLGTKENDIANSLGQVDFDLGIIAGTKSFNLILSNFLPNPDDGKVSVENTKIEGMNDHITLPATHTFMMKNKVVIAQIISFLENGKFERDKNKLKILYESENRINGWHKHR